ncbi:MAG: hypothetical protein KJO44_10905 [Gemmatimonadetes bacterium]|nr:hypothetical protein [Gemmatimonadota bacterium]
MATKTYTLEQIERGEFDRDISRHTAALMVYGTQELMRSAKPILIDGTPEEAVDSDGERMKDKWTVRIDKKDFQSISNVKLGSRAAWINYDAGAGAIDSQRGSFDYKGRGNAASFTRQKGVSPNGVSRPGADKIVAGSEAPLKRGIQKAEARFGRA